MKTLEVGDTTRAWWYGRKLHCFQCGASYELDESSVYHPGIIITDRHVMVQCAFCRDHLNLDKPKSSDSDG